MKSLMKLFLLPLGVLAVQTVQAQHWGYTGASGPEHLSELESDYAMCGQGRTQSPIDLAVLYQEGPADPLLSKMWDAVPAKEGEKATLLAGIDVTALLPFAKTLGFANHRPLQPVNARVVAQ